MIDLMRLLILGGTWFLGRCLAEAALSAGWSVTTFNRGRSAPDVDGVVAVHGDREDVEVVRRLAEHGPWDAVVDTSGFTPANVLAVSRVLEPVATRYVFVSTVNVYTGWPNEPLSEASRLFDCPPDADGDYGAELGYAGQYGALKVGCEHAVEEAFGEDRAIMLRPGVILGPHEYVGRLTWWLARAARGGRMLAPGPRDRAIQPVDVRDVAAFALHAATTKVPPGAYNVTAPTGHSTFGELVDACVEAAGSGVEPVWVEPDWLLERGVEQWTELPLWRTHAGVWAVDSSLAEAAGLRCRPLTSTVSETWAWMCAGGSGIVGEGEAARAADHGLTDQRERELLADWGRST